jgi:hypothetical protein
VGIPVVSQPSAAKTVPPKRRPVSFATGVREADIKSAVDAALAQALPAILKMLEGKAVREDVPDVLPPRELPGVAVGGGGRLRGGVQRQEPRMESVRRNLAGDLEEGQIDKLDGILRAHSQVGSFPQQLVSKVKSESLLAASLAEGGMVEPRDANEKMVQSLLAVLKPEKDVKPKAYKSFKDWFEKLSRMGLFSQNLHAKSPEAYFAMDWHLKCVLFVMSEHGWPTAAAYSERVLKRWDRIDTEEASSSEDACDGDWEMALHTGSLTSVLLSSKSTTTTTGGGKGYGQGSGGGKGYGQGAPTKVNADDTYCDHHKSWFLKKSDHTTKTCRLAKKLDGGSGKKEG